MRRVHASTHGAAASVLRRAQGVAVAACLAALSIGAAAADARERSLIRQGMVENEVVKRIGAPDQEMFLRNVRGQPEEKIWTYLPASGDPRTQTDVTLRAGVVSGVERKIVR